eukprot:13257153-Heterocapsa_arctica.AAC.1
MGGRVPNTEREGKRQSERHPLGTRPQLKVGRGTLSEERFKSHSCPEAQPRSAAPAAPVLEDG